MVSGVPQGTVFVYLLLLFHINDIPAVVSAKVRLFADDQVKLQADLNLFESTTTAGQDMMLSRRKRKHQ